MLGLSVLLPQWHFGLVFRCLVYVGLYTNGEKEVHVLKQRAGFITFNNFLWFYSYMLLCLHNEVQYPSNKMCVLLWRVCVNL